ncbi:hypothetical protein [Ruminococcus sp.]|uniref:hypothetical protein n=2 Tax=Ruminococcus sp. TaxID=41978 RepID=UPI003FD7F40B
MKTKLRRFVSILSAMVLMICCAVPAFADDTVTRNDLSKVKWNLVNSGSDVPHFDVMYKRSQRLIDSFPEYKSDNYIAIYGKKSDESYIATFILFPPDNTAFYNFSENKFMFKTEKYYPQSFQYVYDLQDKYVVDQGLQVGNGTAFDFKYYDLSSCQVYIHTKLYDWSNPDNDLTPDPNAPPTPFTVDYSPSLKTGLVRKGTLVAPGASNDGQEVETNSIAVTVKMTDAFLNASKPISGAYTYSYQFTCFVVPSEYKDSDIKTMSEHAIYTAAQDNLHYLYYENETLDVDDSLSSQPSTGELAPVSEQWANATGVSNCFLLERDNNNTPLRNVTIDLHNIDFEKHKSDSYNIVILGHIVRKSEYGWTAYPSFFKSDCSSLALESTKEYPMNFGSTEQPVVNKKFYDYYSVISADWSFKDYPKFEPHKVGGVTVGDSPLDFKRTAKGVQDYNMWEQGGTDNTLKPDDFDKYKEQKKLDENFGSVDFGLDSIKSVFDGSSDFFKFLTASIGILPTTFLTILISFFVVMLAICVVKWVLK